MEQTFSVEQGFAIGLIFFLDLWPLVEPQALLLDGDKPVLHDLFFRDVCLGYEVSAEWNEAVLRVTGIPRESQRNLKLTEKDVFLCAIEFAKFYNERWESSIDYTVHFLESMKKDSKNHQKAWAVWQKAKDDFMSGRTTFYDLDWTAVLPW